MEFVRELQQKEHEKKIIFFLWAGALGFLILAVQHPGGTAWFFFIELWINKFCSFLKAALLKKLAKASVNCLHSEHVVWITSLLMFPGVARPCMGVSFFFFFFFCVRFLVSKREFLRDGRKDRLGILSPLKTTFIYPINVPVMLLCSDFTFIRKA